MGVNERQQGEYSALTVVVGLRNESEVLDAHHENERPEDERKDAQHAVLARSGRKGRDACVHRVEGARPYVSKHYPERAQAQCRLCRRAYAGGRGVGHLSKYCSELGPESNFAAKRAASRLAGCLSEYRAAIS